MCMGEEDRRMESWTSMQGLPQESGVDLEATEAGDNTSSNP